MKNQMKILTTIMLIILTCTVTVTVTAVTAAAAAAAAAATDINVLVEESKNTYQMTILECHYEKNSGVYEMYLKVYIDSSSPFYVLATMRKDGSILLTPVLLEKKYFFDEPRYLIIG